VNIPIFGKENPFAKFFRFGRLNDEHTHETAEAFENSKGFSQEEIEFGRYPYSEYDSNGYYGMASINIQFEQFFRQKYDRIFKYREMSYYPDINDAIDIICDEAMCEDSDGRIMTLNIKEELPEYIEEQLRDYWDYLINEVFVVNDTAWDMFRRWLIDSEIYLELILNDEGDTIIDFKMLPPQTMSPVYINSQVSGYVQNTQLTYGGANMGVGVVSTNDGSQSQQYAAGSGDTDGGHDAGLPDEVRFDKDQIVYVPYQKTGRNPLDVTGFLEASIRVYNQLKYLEDAVVVYRIVRAPERRIWNIAVGRMPKGKAEQYIRGIVQRYRKKIHYDSSTGAMDSSQNFQAMTEDFWFARNENGEGTTVETLAGGQNLGEMADVYFFEKKLHQTLKLPSSRWGGNGDEASSSYTTGKSGEIAREEIKFSRFVERLQKKFTKLFMDSFLTLLRLQGFDDTYIDESLYHIKYTQSNLWRQYKELELLESRFGILGAIETYIYKPQENENAPFSMEFVLKNWFLMSEEEYEENDKLVTREKEAAKMAGLDAGFGGEEEGGDEFGAGGGGEFGGGEEGFGGEAGGGEEFGGEAGGGEEFGAETGGEEGSFDAEV